jgi:4-amino-4-deoxy-L-arabinose transferase-like glycosyltransferase
MTVSSIDAAQPASPRETYRPIVGVLTTERLTWLLVSAVFLLGLVLRVNCLDCYSLWYDEVTSVETAQRGWEGIFGYRFGWVGNQTPLHYMLVWLTAQFADPVEASTWVRLPSVLAGALTVLVVYRLGSVLVSRAHGVVAALLVALTPTLLDYSQDLRPYSMLTFLTALSVLCLTEAARGGRTLWWLGFVFSTILNLLNSVVALTFVLPPLGLYVLWLGWKLWRERSAGGEARKRFLCLGLSLLAIGCVALPTLIGVMSVPRYTAGDSSLTPADLLSLLVVLGGWFTQIKIDDPLDSIVQNSLLALAVVGGFLAIRARKENGFAALPLLLFTLVPWVIMTYFMSRYFVTPRYVLFAAPFFLLLVTYALLYPFSLLKDSVGRGTWVGRAISALPLTITILLFGAGALSYASVEMSESFPDRPDYRAATQYLERVAGPQDAIVFADQHALGYTVAMLYWRNSPPAPTYDARDPRLGGYATGGDIFWVGAIKADLLEELPSIWEGWRETVIFRSVVIVRERPPAANMLDNLDHMIKRLRGLRPESRPFIALEANVHQARGEVSEAASDYHISGQERNQVLGNEFLRTAKGFAERGQMEEAWRETAISKFMWPSNPELDRWIGQLLRDEGNAADALVAEQVADALASMGVK